MKGETPLNLSGNDVHYTNSSILLVTNMLCGKLQCQKDFNLVLFPCTIGSGPLSSECDTYKRVKTRFWPGLKTFFQAHVLKCCLLVLQRLLDGTEMLDHKT